MSINLLIFSNADCEWRIVAANTSHIIQMVVEDTSIEYHADCVYDAAEVYDGKLYTLSKKEGKDQKLLKYYHAIASK